MQRVGTPDDIARLAVFLASDLGGYITGQTFIVDGGATAHQPWHPFSDIVHPQAFQPDGLTGATVPRD